MTSETSGNYKTTLEKGGRNPPDVTLDYIVRDLLKFFNGFQCLDKAKMKIEQKYNIKKEHGDCWPDDDIKRAWGKTKRLSKTKNIDKRKHWACVITLQLMKRWLYCYEFKRREEPSDLIKGENSAQSCEAFSLSNSSEQMDTDEENVNLEAAEPRIKEQRGSETNKQKSKGSKQKKKQQSMASDHSQTESASLASQSKPSPVNESDMSNNKEFAKKPPKKPTVYIRIPLSAMSGTESTSKKDEECSNTSSSHKLMDKLPLIDKLPSMNEIRKRESYILSYNKETKSPEWVYEILNKSTLKSECKKYMSFGRKDLDYTGYDQGHLAAATNHTWCQEAYHDTFLLSNMTPQVSEFNKGKWCKLEQYCRDIVKKDNVRNVHVYTGALHLKREGTSYIRVTDPSKMKSLKNKVVPTDLFKVVIVENSDGTVREPECYLMPNESENKTKPEDKVEELLEKYWKIIENIEKLSGQKITQFSQDREKKENSMPEVQEVVLEELLERYSKKIEDIEEVSGLKFTQFSQKCSPDREKMVKWTGEDKNGDLRNIDFKVRICTPHAGTDSAKL